MSVPGPGPNFLVDANHLAEGLHTLLTVCIGSKPCRPSGTHVHVGCRQRVGFLE